MRSRSSSPSPTRRAGARGAPRPTPVGAAAEELGIPVLRPATINDPEVIEAIAGHGAEALVVVAFGQILRDAVLSRWPCVNVHFSLLPAYRGAAPSSGRSWTGWRRPA